MNMFYRNNEDITKKSNRVIFLSGLLLVGAWFVSCVSTSVSNKTATQRKCSGQEPISAQETIPRESENGTAWLRRTLLYEWVANVMCKQPAIDNDKAVMISLLCGAYGRDSSTVIKIFADRATKTTGPIVAKQKDEPRPCTVQINEEVFKALNQALDKVPSGDYDSSPAVVMDGGFCTIFRFGCNGRIRTIKCSNCTASSSPHGRAMNRFYELTGKLFEGKCQSN